MPLLCNAAEIAHGSPPHSSLPSVMSKTTLRAFLSGKSLAQASNERAIGVVPLGFNLSSFALINHALPFENGTSRFVSSQS